ncbi:MAG: inosine/xanthosine triphosphatase [Candidatus Brockarchaeota archaeon]|nr:inosine/xanthosine triphosphatase [Candidatus Brockarchaeota archaeon]
MRKSDRIRIAIGSKNPVKVKAVENVMRKIYGDVEIISFGVPTDVSHTPLSDEECMKGAIKRAKDAIELAKADLGVGMEGGIVKRLDRYFLTGWCVVIDKNGELAIGHGGGIELPKKIVEKVFGGEELGNVMDKILGIKETKRKMGAVGILTDGMIDRQEAWEKTLIYAMARKLKPELYNDLQTT